MSARLVGRGLRCEGRQPRRERAHLFDARHAGLARPAPTVPSISPDTSASISCRRLSWKRSRGVAPGILRLDGLVDGAVDCGTRPATSSARQHAGRKRVVQVRRIVGYFVGQVDQLRLQRRPQAGQVRLQFRALPGPEVARVLDDPLPHLERQVQSGKARVALLEDLHDPQRDARAGQGGAPDARLRRAIRVIRRVHRSHLSRLDESPLTARDRRTCGCRHAPTATCPRPAGNRRARPAQGALRVGLARRN